MTTELDLTVERKSRVQKGMFSCDGNEYCRALCRKSFGPRPDIYGKVIDDHLLSACTLQTRTKLNDTASVLTFCTKRQRQAPACIQHSLSPALQPGQIYSLSPPD